MNPSEIIDLCRNKGIELRPDGNHLRFNAPVGVLTAELRQVLTMNKQAILEHFQQRQADSITGVPHRQPHVNRHPIPLSFAQQRLWFLDQWEPKSTAYLQSYAWRLHGPLDHAVLEASMNDLGVRHDNLRVSFSSLNEHPIQIIAPSMCMTLPVFDLTALAESPREDQLQNLIQENTQRGFDLTRGPLWRAQLICLRPEEHVLLFTIHHIITDGWSMGIIWKELEALYTARLAGKPVNLPPLPLQYADFAVWQRQWFQGDVLERQLTYWRTQLAGAPPSLELPTDRLRPPDQSYQGHSISFAFPASLTRALKTFSQQESVTLFMTLLGAFQLLLFRHTGQRDILVGAPMAGRTHTDLEGLIGFFVNTLVLRTRFTDHSSFREVLRQVRRTCLEAYAHQDLPFEQLVETLQPVRDLSRQPVVQVMFQLFGQHAPTFSLPNIHTAQEPITRQSVKFDLNCTLREINGFLQGSMEYRTDLFASDTIQRLVGHYQHLLEGIIANPDQQATTLPILSHPERQQLLVGWNKTSRDYADTKFLHQLFETQVENTPDATAVVHEGQHLTYRELNRRANQLAHFLESFGVGPEIHVALVCERSLELVVGLWGVLKAGGVYIPIDPTFPSERIAWMLQEAPIAVVLTHKKPFIFPFPQSVRVVYLDEEWPIIGHMPTHNCRPLVNPENLAYILYTSGSTGQPKGVMVTHRGVLNYLNWAVERLEASKGRGTVVQSSISFDLTVTSLFCPLLAGDKIELLSELGGLQEMVQALQKEGEFSFLKITPAHLEGLNQLMGSEQLAGKVRTLIIEGEALSEHSVKMWHHHAPNTILINEYGPTETVVGCSIYEVSPSENGVGTIPIGRPIPNVRIYVLQNTLQVSPIGVPGEIYIAGESLARGYLNRPNLTAERFIPEPFASQNGLRQYKTGDRAKYRNDGVLEFLGRTDHQVKVRGHRIELGEIESVISQHPDVQNAVVLYREDSPDMKRLIAYVVVAEPTQLTTIGLLTWLKRTLPDYMLPSAFVFPASLPLTPTGKIDRKALPAPGPIQAADGLSPILPQSPVEELVAEIWRDILKVEHLDVNENFFALGGHSLLATQVVSRLRHVLEFDFPLRAIFEHPTVAQLAREIDVQLAKIFPHGPPNELENPHAHDS